MNDHESLQVVDLSNNEGRLEKLVKHGGKTTFEEVSQDQKGSPRTAVPKPVLQPVDELVSISKPVAANKDDPTVTLAERVLKQLFEYENRLAVLEKRRLQDLKKIRKLGKENDELRDINEKLMARKYPPANSRAPKRAPKSPNEAELIMSLTDAIQGIEKIVTSLVDKRQENENNDAEGGISNPALVKSALLVEDLNKQLISLCDLG